MQICLFTVLIFVTVDELLSLWSLKVIPPHPPILSSLPVHTPLPPTSTMTHLSVWNCPTLLQWYQQSTPTAPLHCLTPPLTLYHSNKSSPSQHCFSVCGGKQWRKWCLESFKMHTAVSVAIGNWNRKGRQNLLGCVKCWKREDCWVWRKQRKFGLPKWVPCNMYMYAHVQLSKYSPALRIYMFCQQLIVLILLCEPLPHLHSHPPPLPLFPGDSETTGIWSWACTTRPTSPLICPPTERLTYSINPWSTYRLTCNTQYLSF